MRRICRLGRWQRPARRTTVAIRKGISQSAQMIVKASSRGPPSEGFAWAVYWCQGDGIKLVYGEWSGQISTFWESSAQQRAFGVFIRPRCQGAMRVAERRSSGPVSIPELSRVCGHLSSWSHGQGSAAA